MGGRVFTISLGVAALAVGFLLGRSSSPDPASGSTGFAAVPTQPGGQDLTGPYEPVADWPRPLAGLPGHSNWTWGAVEGIFAESPDRIFLVQLGELPNIERPSQRAVPDFGPSLSFPVGGVPFRNASQGPAASLPGPGGTNQDPDDPNYAYRGRIGIDARWEHTIVVVDGDGNIIEDWTQWDSLLKRPHSIYINPYDPVKHVWIVDDFNHSLFKFSNDGSELVQTIGTPGVQGADGTHFNRPTYLAWLPDSTLFVADGYRGTRIAKFDAEGNFLMDWGESGTPPNEMRPGYMNGVHGIAVDPVSRRVFVSDRSNDRIQVFDENGNFITAWTTGPLANSQFLYVGEDSHLWMLDGNLGKFVKYDSEGHLLYAWGTRGDFPGGLFNPHMFSVDQEGNLYIAEVGNGRAQKLVPRAGANPASLIPRPFYSAWQ